MMRFRVLKKNIIDLLGEKAADSFKVIGYQRQVKSAKDLKEGRRLAQVYFEQVTYPESAGRLRGKVTGNYTYAIELSLAAPAKMDVQKILDAADEADPEVAEQMRAHAMQSFVESAEVADEAWDEFAEVVWQILMDSTQYDFKMDKGTISNRWITEIRKDDTLPVGEQVLLTGRLTFTVHLLEEVQGASGVQGEMIDLGLRVREDLVARTGVIVEQNEGD